MEVVLGTTPSPETIFSISVCPLSNKCLKFGFFQQINPTGVVQKLFNINVLALKPFSRYIQHALQNHIEHSK